MPGSGAAEAGMVDGDVILRIDGVVAATPESAASPIRSHAPGEQVSVEFMHSGERRTVSMRILRPPFGEQRVALAGGAILSRRATGFGEVIQHDSIVAAQNMGGPVVDSRGRVVGLNIARADRMKTYALSARRVRASIEAMLARVQAGVIMPPDDPSAGLPAVEFAPDGSLFIVDWHNVLIGHMQHNARDPLRDHVHGRIYRITYPSRPLVKPASIAQANLATLLDNLKVPEYRTRYRTRLALRSRGAAEVMPALLAWTNKLDAADPRYEHHLTEALWVTWGLNAVDITLLEKVMKSKDFRARAAAVRVVRYNAERIPNALTYLANAAKDEHGRVRLEAVVASSWINDTVAKQILTIAAAKPIDPWIKPTIDTMQARLKGVTPPPIDANPMPAIPAHLNPAEKELFRQGHEVYHREAALHEVSAGGRLPIHHLAGDEQAGKPSHHESVIQFRPTHPTRRRNGFRQRTRPLQRDDAMLHCTRQRNGVVPGSV
jgi:hypothetical protein